MTAMRRAIFLAFLPGALLFPLWGCSPDNGEDRPDADVLGILGVPQKPGAAADAPQDAGAGTAAEGGLSMNISQPAFNADRPEPEPETPKARGGALDY